MAQVSNIETNAIESKQPKSPELVRSIDSPRSVARFKNRSRMEIVANMLDIGRTGALKTHLMYKANLSFMVVTQYLEFLTSTELMERTLDEDGMVRRFQTTPRGLKYLEVYDSIRDLARIDHARQ